MTVCAVCSKPDKPVQAEPGSLLCWRCSGEILTFLRHIEACVLALSPEPVVGEKGRRSPGFGSSSPARDAVLIHTDPRGWWSRDDGLGATAMLHMWCRMIREERHLDMGQDRTTIVTEAAFLRSHHAWACAQPWADEYHDELRKLRGQVRALLGMQPDGPQGKCWVILDDRECGGPLWWTDDRDGLVCGDCKRTYRGAELLRYQVGQEAG